MTGLLHELKVQRWDDHRYYHHSKVNQSLHLLSATSQIGHLFFEPRGYDAVNQATDEYKEEIKVGYNIQRKLVLLAIWAASPLLLVVDPTLLGVFTPHADWTEFVTHVGELWLVVGLAGIAFRALQLFVTKDLTTGLVWVTKIATDPFHDIKLYHRAPWELLTGRYSRHTPETVAAPILPDELLPEVIPELPATVVEDAVVPASKGGV